MGTKIKSSNQLFIDDNLNLEQKRIVNLADPEGSDEAATKKYVDMIAQGLVFKQSVRAATTGTINLSSPGSSIDGVTLSSKDRVLVKNQVNEAQNGIYIFNGQSDPMTRAADANDWDELVSAFVFVEEGVSNADTAWVCLINRGGTLGTTPIIWNQFSAANNFSAGDGIDITGNVISTKLNNTGGLEFTSGEMRIKLDGSTLQSSTNGLKVADNTFQPLNDRLTSIANMEGNGFLVKNNNSFLARSIVAGSGIIVNNSNGIVGNPEISVNSSLIVFRNRFVFYEIPAGDINGSNTVFQPAYEFEEATLNVFRNGLLQRIQDDYFIDNGRIQFFDAPLQGDYIIISYLKV